ncbi:Efflux pump vrtL [Exophiala dermatitidis]
MASPPNQTSASPGHTVEYEKQMDPSTTTKQEPDLEAGFTSSSEPSATTTLEGADDKEATKDPNLVTWDGPDDPENPKNWPSKTKWSFTVAVSVFTFISPVSSAMIAPALAKLGEDLHMTRDIEIELSLSIFILAYAVGPLFFGPASELWGRVRLLQLSNLWYLAWNLGCGFATNKPEIFIFRFLAGAGGSAPLAIGGGCISDVWTAEERGKAMGIYTLAPILGPVVGPIAGGWIAEKTTWRWVFWSSSALALGIQVVGLIWLKESHPPTILRRRRDRLVKETGNHELKVYIPQPITPGQPAASGPDNNSNNSTPKVLLQPDKPPSLLHTIGSAFIRPGRLIATQPIVQVIALYMAYLFGVMYLLLATFSNIWSEVYHESRGIGGFNYISIAIGSFVGVFANFYYIDRIYKHLKAKNGGVGRPEFRIPSMIVGSATVTVGLFWYGWSVQARIHWIMPNLGVAIFSAGTIGCLQSMQTYTVDSYTRYAASALAAVAIFRSLAGFAFPLFAPYMYKALDYGWGTSVLAFISIGIGFPAPFIFWLFGPKLRAMSKYAAG